MDELLARIRALTRRAAGRAEPSYEHEGATDHPGHARGDGQWSAGDFVGSRMGRAGILCWQGQVALWYSNLQDKLYGWGDEVSSNAVEVYIHGLRKKLGAGLIINVRGVGYMVPKS